MSKESAVNGTGLTNGAGMVNGTGMINGSGLVNGTGIVNGTLASNGSSRGQRPRGIVKGGWKILVVLVAVAISLPTIMYLIYSEGPSPYEIDGDFGDWSDATVFEMRTSAVSSSINVSGWSVSVHGVQLYLYVETVATIMGTSTVDSFFLFADIDGVVTTGYSVADIGAEYMIELDGWDGAVQSDSLSQYPSSGDVHDWNLWEDVGSVVWDADGTRLEAAATLSAKVRDSACFVLVAQNGHEERSVSYSVPIQGGLLVVKQIASVDGPGEGLADQASSTGMMRLRFSCQGEAGTVESVPIEVVGADLARSVSRFTLSVGGEETTEIRLDTMAAASGDFVSAAVDAAGVESSFARVIVVGSAARAYVLSAPGSIEIDGAFADWDGKAVSEFDDEQLANPDIDIESLGGAFEADSSFFYVRVSGNLFEGSFVPTVKGKPSSGGSGGTVAPTRKSAEDVLRVFIDSDFSYSTGLQKTVESKLIGADYMVEVKGSDCRVVSASLSSYVDGGWAEMMADVDAAVDSKRIEIGLPASAIGGASAVDFIIETTDWKERTDSAGIDLETLMAMSSYFVSAAEPNHWVIDPGASSAYATAVSFQRKLVFDGSNYWSFYFDGTNTVYRYSSNGGVTWTSGGSVFKTSGINETSVWFDSANDLVYAVGDRPSSSYDIYVQRGVLDSAAKTITWAASDKALNVSSYALSAKHAYISKDACGHLWILTSNRTSATTYDLSAFRSASVDSITSWVHTGNMLAPDPGSSNVKGSIVPASSGCVVWSVYTYRGDVGARKYTGAWQSEFLIYDRNPMMESAGNMDTAPPSVVVDSKGVVHVVYGSGHRVTGVARPFIYYSHNATDSTSFTTSLRLDSVGNTNGNVYPTVTLDESTGNLFAFWIQIDNQNLMGKKNVSGTWTSLSMGSQTSYTKQFLTSIYSVPSESNICWMWTQNTTGNIDVVYDKIPEFSDAFVPVLMLIIMVAVFRRRALRAKDETL